MFINFYIELIKGKQRGCKSSKIEGLFIAQMTLMTQLTLFASMLLQWVYTR